MVKQFMNSANVYWQPPQYTVTSLKPISGNVGFLMNLPWPDPVTAGFYEGQGNENIYGKRELVFSNFPEMIMVGGVLPTTSGIPRVDPNSFAAKFSREHYTVRH